MENDPRFDGLKVILPEYHETLHPTHVVRELEPKDPVLPWMMLIQILSRDIDLDKVVTADSRNWQASPQAKFERLLRETRVPLGLLCNGRQIRMIYAPRGETSGYMTFGVAEMAQVAGRPIFAALHMLLCAERLFSLGEKQRLPAILADSRKYQNVVSTKLAEQVLASLYELVRGFQAANDHAKGTLLHDVLVEDPNHVYAGLLTVLMRLVFILFAEDRGLISNDAVYGNFYSITGLFERLRADDGRYPDTMNLRYGAWAQLLTLFRLIYQGGSHAGLKIPARHGYLFDPDRYNFLEGRQWKTPRDRHEGEIRIPHVSDGVIFRVLNNLLILDGERLSYRTLDVEQIGSVYEVTMGFGLGVAKGVTIAIKPKVRLGAPVPIDLDELLLVAGAERGKWIKANTDQEITGEAATALKVASNIPDLLAALERRIAHSATPSPIPKGGMVPIPSDERRRSGSNYTPRSLTQPIVETTLRPILQRLGEKPTPSQILDLKVCDPAMGSGAFHVEVCRQLADELVKAWHNHKQIPVLPPDEDEILHARRLVAERCLYGVDRNPMAVDLAKLSLWLATLAKDHPFTFLDHNFRCGDSLVGLTRKQISEFHWKPDKQMVLGQQYIQDRVRDAARYRQEILAAGDHIPHDTKRQKLAAADDRLDGVRFFGDLVIAAFFGADKDKLRIERRNELLGRVSEYLRTMNLMLRPGDALRALGTGARAIRTFHWEIEFPEVFERKNGGFDAIVGNPPFLSSKSVWSVLGLCGRDFLKVHHSDSGGKAVDLVAHFFRQSFDCLANQGTMGLIATNTVAQGDTRFAGLGWICKHGGRIYAARKRVQWHG
ncbi:MAG TPA: N-6 DNA methylase, partial [Humisphaera sp.]|nr:N-6 DNA methylase [Humisphaera sp.]